MFDLLLAGDHKAAEDVFVDCKKSIDANKHAVDLKVTRRRAPWLSRGMRRKGPPFFG